MESLYKKKNLKFSGFHKEIIKGEVRTAREASRQKRLSTLRDLSFKDSKENISELHKLGEKKRRIPSRNEMLQKWKDEKATKQQQKESTAKSLPMPGFCFKKKISSTVENKNKTDDAKLNAQRSNVTQRTGSQNSKTTSSVLKSAPQFIKPSSMLKIPTMPATKSTSANVKSQVSQRPVASKSVLNLKAPTQKMGPTSLSLRTSALQGKTLSKETKPTVQKAPNTMRNCPQPSKVASLANTRVASKNAISHSKVTQKLPLVKPKLEKDTKSANISSANKLSKITFPKNTNDLSSRLGSKKNQIVNGYSTKTELEESKRKTGDIFICDLSTIEPSMKRKSFAPNNFLFCPPAEWSFPFQMEVSSSEFLKLKSNSVQRTSSPLKFEENSKSSSNELSTIEKKEDSSPNHSLQEGISFKEKTKSFPSDNQCQRNLSGANAPSLNVKADILDIKVENKCTGENSNISVFDFTNNLSTKLPLSIFDDIQTEDKVDLHEKVASPEDFLSFSVNVEPTLLVALDCSTAQIAFKDCDTNSNKTIKEDKELETSKRVTSEALVSAISIDSTSQNLSHILVPIDNSPQNIKENLPNLSVPSSSENPEHDKFYETEICSTFDTPEENQLINIDSVDVMFSYKPVDSVPENNGDKPVMPLCNGDLCVTSSNQNLEQDKTLETVNCMIPKVLEKDNQVETDALSSCSVPENCWIGTENHVDQCTTSLSELLKSFNLATSVSERVSEKVTMRHQKLKMSQRYALESINESLESRGTPCATPLEKLIAEETFSPRRSPRLLEKLNRSGSFESILNTEKPEGMNSLDLDGIVTEAPKSLANGPNRTPVSCKKKQMKDKDFTPRRSQRISEMMRRSSSYENLFEVRRPSVMGSPCAGDFRIQDASEITYDFDNLALEDSPKVIKGVKGRSAHISKKVSLLYTPPTRKSIRQSIRGDLMSFSPS